MATKTPTVTAVKNGTGAVVNKTSSVYTKEVKFAVPTSSGAGDYYTGDTIDLGAVIPAGTAVTGLWYKVSATQGATLTFAAQLDAGSAFVSAVNLTSTTFAPLTIVAANAVASATADSSLKFVLAGTTVGTTAATISLVIQLATLEGQTGLTTFTI